jgi:hypothetical protein
MCCSIVLLQCFPDNYFFTTTTEDIKPTREAQENPDRITTIKNDKVKRRCLLVMYGYAVRACRRRVRAGGQQSGIQFPGGAQPTVDGIVLDHALPGCLGTLAGKLWLARQACDVVGNIGGRTRPDQKPGLLVFDKLGIG